MRTATDWLQMVLDPGWVEHNGDLGGTDPLDFPGYKNERPATVAASGASGGFPVEAISFDFEVHGGSMDVATGEKVARTFERALARRAAVVALTASGGARMQEGMPALVQMVKTVSARTALTKAGLPFIAYLRNPTTGGVYASFASLADLLWAEPGATIGFAGPRVAEAATGTPLPKGSHTAEFSLERGLIDELVAPDDLRRMIRRALDLTLGPDGETGSSYGVEPAASKLGAWDEVLLSRHPDRPTGAGFARMIASDLIELRGDRAGDDDRAVVAALARISGRRCGVVALDRSRPRPAAYRKAYRLIRLAGALGLPLVTFIDTPGADPSSASESAGIARSIATAFRTVLEHPAPTVAVVTGEGGSGGALAYAACDRVLILEHAIFSVIAPEAAAAILKRTDVRQVAHDLRLTSNDLRRFGIADRVIAEPHPAAHADPARAGEAIARSIAAALGELPEQANFEVRRGRWREAGNEFLA